tara:strand:+ start:17332 stop:18738 length:1407 start_codon:yes stop_codon:yes gene_type:complete
MDFELPSIRRILDKIQRDSYALYGIDANELLKIGGIKTRLSDHGISYDDFVKCYLIKNIDRSTYEDGFDSLLAYYGRSADFDDEDMNSFGAALHIDKTWQRFAEIIEVLPHYPRSLETPTLYLRSAPIGDLSSRIIISHDRSEVAIVGDSSLYDLAKCLCDMFSVVTVENQDNAFSIIPDPDRGSRFRDMYIGFSPTPDVVMPIFSATTWQTLQVDYARIPKGKYQNSASNIMMDGLYAFVVGHEYAHFIQSAKNYTDSELEEIALKNKAFLKGKWQEKYAEKFLWPDDEKIVSRFKNQAMEFFADFTSIDLIIGLNHIEKPSNRYSIDMDSYTYLYFLGVWIGFYIVLYRDRLTYLFETGDHWDEENMPFLARDYALHNLLSESDHPCIYSRIDSIVKQASKSSFLQQLNVSDSIYVAMGQSIETVSSYFDFCWAMGDYAKGKMKPTPHNLSPRIRYLRSQNNQVNY